MTNYHELPPAKARLIEAQRAMKERNQPPLSPTKQAARGAQHLKTIKSTVRQYLEEVGCNPIQELIRLARESEAVGNFDLAIRAFGEIVKYAYPRLSTQAVFSTKTDRTESAVILGIMADPALCQAAETLALAMAAEKRKQIQSPIDVIPC